MATKTKNKEFQLDPEWIYQDPIDFEHKKYKLLAYLQKCDKRFDELKIYPDFVEPTSSLSKTVVVVVFHLTFVWSHLPTSQITLVVCLEL